MADLFLADASERGYIRYLINTQGRDKYGTLGVFHRRITDKTTFNIQRSGKSYSRKYNVSIGNFTFIQN
ncbi:hypothetical protein V9L05_17265 [Bernardetia sp. Wsw4-3y2]|uniref:hypothetical protein n=1 Tax=Bernardetia sp. Wsw4-3y2 TaxID=3127471 RepID=UPI0030CFD0BE